MYIYVDLLLLDITFLELASLVHSVLWFWWLDDRKVIWTDKLFVLQAAGRCNLE